MKKLKILVLTDHSGHSKENSIYAMIPAMLKHPQVEQIDVATRGDVLNRFFFQGHIPKSLFVTKATETFAFSPKGDTFKKNLRREFLREYDAVWLRLPPPLAPDFLFFLKTVFSGKIIVNDPFGIYETGSKEFLMKFEEFCPPMKVCKSIEDIVNFKSQFPIVLKPFREYGGRGLVRIDGHQVWEGSEKTDFLDFIEKIKDEEIEYLGVKFLKNVSKGDKRIVVVNGEIIGASLRLPAKDSWLCNVAQGGRSVSAEVDDREREIVERVNPLLSNLGIAMYGIDTLVGDDGQRILSELNTTSIGGVPQMAQLTGLPLVEKTVDRIMDFIIEKIYDKSAVA